MNLLMESFLQPTSHIELKCDNQATTAYSEGERTSRAKNLINKVQFIREMVSNKELVVSYINTKEQAADMFTKSLDKGDV